MPALHQGLTTSSSTVFWNWAGSWIRFCYYFNVSYITASERPARSLSSETSLVLEPLAVSCLPSCFETAKFLFVWQCLRSSISIKNRTKVSRQCSGITHWYLPPSATGTGRTGSWLSLAQLLVEGEHASQPPPKVFQQKVLLNSSHKKTSASARIPPLHFAWWQENSRE